MEALEAYACIGHIYMGKMEKKLEGNEWWSGGRSGFGDE